MGIDVVEYDTKTSLGDDVDTSNRSYYTSDQSSVAHSPHSRGKSSSASPANVRQLLVSPGGSLRRKIGAGRFKSFKPKADVPPLNFAAAGLVGRDEEMSTLKSRYELLIMSQGNNKELILVAGESGVGKSSVIRTMKKLISVDGLFVEGKFDMNTSNEPYSGVADAFGKICRKIKEAGPETVADLQEKIIKELGGNPKSLVQMIPELQDLLGVEVANESSKGSIGRVDEVEGGVDRLRFAFRVLTRVCSSAFSPLILFFDDLQWSDVSSLQVLEYLISDSHNDNPLMIIGSYRSEEVDVNSLLHNKIISLRQKTEKFHFQMTELKIQPFSESDIEKIITTVLPSLRADHIVGLAALCHKRTLGNPFFTIEFLKMLHFEGMVSFDEITETWSWDLSDIQKQTMSAENVVVMLEQHLRKLPEQVQALLQCAAYLGSSFGEATIDLVWSVYGRRLVDTRTDPVSSLLPILVADRVFEKSDNKQYRWAHDKLQEAALSLSGTLRETFQLDIGKALYYGLTKEQVEEDLFAIVDLVNNGNTLKRPEFAVMNLRAAEKARGISAFQSAADYAAEGIILLQEADWVQNKALALGLYGIGAESELMLGNVDSAARYRDVVLSRSDLTTIEMLPFEVGKVKALSDVELKSKEALDYCVKLLKKLGCRLTWARSLAFPQAAVQAILTVKRAKAKPDFFYEALKPSDDVKQKFIAYLLSKAIYNAYIVGDETIYLLACVELVESTIKYGVNEFSATTFTFLGLLASYILRDYELMVRFHNIGLGMVKKFRGIHAAESMYTGELFGELWVKPLETARAVFEKGVLVGRREGNLVFTSWAIILHAIILPYATGRPIHSILESCPDILTEFEETKLAAHQLSVKAFHQMLLNISDPSCEQPSIHIGKIYKDTKEDHKGNLVHLGDKLVEEGELCFWHEDYEISARRALKVGETHAKIAPSNFLNQIESFHRAVALYAAAIKTKKRKYRTAANKIRKKLATFVEYGNTTIQYYHLFLTAEKLSLEKRCREAKMKYEAALLIASNLGHLHHLGLMNERYSDFLQRDLAMEKESRYRLQEAIRYYTEWGAVHKVKALEARL